MTPKTSDLLCWPLLCIPCSYLISPALPSDIPPAHTGSGALMGKIWYHVHRINPFLVNGESRWNIPSTFQQKNLTSSVTLTIRTVPTLNAAFKKNTISAPVCSVDRLQWTRTLCPFFGSRDKRSLWGYWHGHHQSNSHGFFHPSQYWPPPVVNEVL